MRNETKIAILFSGLVIVVTGSVFAYLVSTDWPDVDSSFLNLHLIRANKNAERAKADAEAAIKAAVPQVVDYSDINLGVSFKHQVGWEPTLATEGVDRALTLSSNGQVVQIIKYANPKMRKTLPEYLSKKFNKEIDIDYKNVVPLTVAGKEAFRVTMNEEGGAIASYDQVWVKVSDFAWLAIGNVGAPQAVVNQIVSSLSIIQ